MVIASKLSCSHWHLLCISDCAVNVSGAGISGAGIQEGRCICRPVACDGSIEKFGIVHGGVVHRSCAGCEPMNIPKI